MLSKHLHIISFDVPFPADYGGVIDVFYKIKALNDAGVKIILHCFKYGRNESKLLNNFCEKVYYYERQKSSFNLLSSLPYVVKSRSSENLISNLLKDDYPILFEGLHCCYYLNDKRLSGRIKIARSHNIEHDYYSNLASVEKSFLKKIYFNSEAKKLKRFENVYLFANHILAISSADEMQLASKYKNVHHITAFHPNSKVQIENTLGDFCLYHGNLGVGENNQAAMYLVNEIFSKCDIPLIIAGKNPSKELGQAIAKNKNVELKANIPTEEIDTLIKKAQINILPTFQATGIKLKLLAVLFNGKHCLVNSPMVVNTGLENLCTISDSAEEMRNVIVRLFTQPFDINFVSEREKILSEKFSNAAGAQKIIKLI